MHRLAPLAALASLALIVSGCEGRMARGGADAGTRDAARAPSLDGSIVDPAAPDASPAADAAPMPPEPMGPTHLCARPRPPGAPMPSPLPSYSGGTCPALIAGTNTIATSGASRRFIVVAPTDPRPGERYPVTFLWHPLGSEATVFLEGGVLQAAADRERFVAVLPYAKGDLMLRWPSTGADGARVSEELRFFDDMLACVAAQWSVNTDCVASGGVSAGALWGNRLASARAGVLSSFVSVSGGSGGAFPAWSTVSHRLPALVLWGGPTDRCAIFSFDDASRALVRSLSADGHAIVECIHNCGHAMPPFDGADPFTPILDFALAHPYWLGAGETPYSSGLPSTFPSWCAVGAGRASARTGACAAPSGC